MYKFKSGKHTTLIHVVHLFTLEMVKKLKIACPCHNSLPCIPPNANVHV